MRPADTDSNWAVMQVNACRLLASEAYLRTDSHCCGQLA